MRYYSQFPRAIPRFRAGSVRVTHPCATKVLLLPFDLHVLGLPLAFILSQDQTLHCKMFVCPSPIISQIELVLIISMLVFNLK